MALALAAVGDGFDRDRDRLVWALGEAYLFAAHLGHLWVLFEVLDQPDRSILCVAEVALQRGLLLQVEIEAHLDVVLFLAVPLADALVAGAFAGLARLQN